MDNGTPVGEDSGKAAKKAARKALKLGGQLLAFAVALEGVAGKSEAQIAKIAQRQRAAALAAIPEDKMEGLEKKIAKTFKKAKSGAALGAEDKPVSAERLAAKAARQAAKNAANTDAPQGESPTEH